MSNEIKAGTLSAPATVKSKVMVLGVHRNENGEILITPMDVEHDFDDQSSLSHDEILTFKNVGKSYSSNEEAMKKGLESLYEVFEKCLYRESFRNFENFCFAIFDTHRISPEVVRKAKERVEVLKEEL